MDFVGEWSVYVCVCVWRENGKREGAREGGKEKGVYGYIC